MIENVRLISVKEQDARRDALLTILRKNNIPFSLHHRKIGEHWVDNIVVSFGDSVPRLVIGAHYDSVEGSCGANDNAAAVSILIEVARYLTDNAVSMPIDIVFFDREEYADKGSEQYINQAGKHSISAMLNLDICGYGNTIVIGPGENIGKNGLSGLLTEKLLKKHNVEVVECLPSGDDRSFESENIPNISIAVLPKDDVRIIERLAVCGKNGVQPTPEMFPAFPEIIKTMHNAENDNIDIVQESAMSQLLSFIMDVLTDMYRQQAVK